MEATKILKVEQAQAGDRAEYISTYESFKNALILKSIDNIFDNPRLKIKRDLRNDGSGGQIYIFNIDGKNTFSISEANIESFIRTYCKEKESKEQKAVEEEIYIEAKGLEIEYYKSSTQEELTVLKKKIEEQNKDLEKITNIDSIKTILSRNLLFLEQQKEYAQTVSKSSKIERNLRKAFISQVNDRLDRLYRMKESLEMLEGNTNKKYTIKRETANGKKELQEIVMDDINGYDMQETLKQIGVRLKEIANEEPDFIATRNSITNKEATSVPYYEIIINDKQDAKRMLKALKKYDKGYAILDKIALDASKKQVLAKDLEKFEAYLNNVISATETTNVAENPFIPEHTADFYSLVKEDEDLSGFIAFNKKKTKITKTEPSEPGKEITTTTTEKTNTPTGTTTETQKEQGSDATVSAYTSGKEAFEKGGISGFLNYQLDKTNMKPEQKQFWNGVGNIALVGGMVFVGRKMISSAFKLIFKKDGYKDNKNRGRVIGPLALIFGSQARSGEGPLSLFKGGKPTEKISNLFRRGGDKTADKDTEKPTESKAYTEGFIGLMGAFGMMNYGNMATFLEETSEGKLKIKENQYDGLIAMLEKGNENQKSGAKFLKTHVGKEDKNGWIDMTLRAMGITSLKTLTDNPTKEFKETVGIAATKVYLIGAFMEKEGFVRINPETMHLVQAYIANENATVDDLEALKKRGDVFELQEAITDKTGLAAKIKILANNDTEKERYLLNGINDFYDYRPKIDKSGLDIIGNGPVVEFKTYGYTTKINIDTKKIEGLNTTKFDSYAELFKAANLTNRLKDICKDKVATKENPFYISGGDLMFDNAKVFSLEFDTEMIKEQSLKAISPTLATFSEEYCTYLNQISPKFRKDQLSS